MSEESIFDAAIRLPANSRAKYLDEACREQPELRIRVNELLKAHDQTCDFIDEVVADDPVTTLIPNWTPEKREFGNYKLLQKIGEGGFGVVFMAEQTNPVQRKVALKIIKPGMDTSTVIARFEAERQALAMMDHPNIARIFDGGEVEYRPFFVMELVKGVPITDYCDKNSLTTQERLDLFMTVCQAVHHAHQKGIIHRDIKPSNVMVTLHDGQPVVKVIDFGVAKAIHQRLTERTMFTEFGQMIGTPQYMSPEQAEMSGLDVDTRSDIYSLGVLVYELLTGKTPLEAKRLRTAGYAEMQRLIREEQPLKPSQQVSTAGEELTVIAEHRSSSPERLHKELKGDLDWIVMKALDKDRRRRYESARDLSVDVQCLLNQEVVSARPPSIAYRASKIFQKHRVAITVGSLFLVTLVGATIAASIGMMWAIDAEKKNARQVVQLNQEKQKLNTANKTNQALAVEAAKNEQTAKRIAQQSESERIAGLEARRLTETNPGLALSLANFAAQRAPQRNTYHNTPILESLRNCRELASFDIQSTQDDGFLPPPDWMIPLDDVGEKFVIGLRYSGAIGIDLRQQKEMFRLGLPTLHNFDQVAIDSTSKTLATVSNTLLRIEFQDGTKHAYTGRVARIWDLETGRETHVLRGHQDRVVSLEFNSDGSQLLTGSLDGTARIWDVRTGEQKLVFDLFGSGIDTSSFSGFHDKRMPVLLARYGDNETRILTIIANRQITAAPDADDLATFEVDPFYALNMQPRTSRRSSGPFRIHAREEGPLSSTCVWDAKTGDPISYTTFKDQNDPAVVAGFFPGGKQFCVLSEVWQSGIGKRKQLSIFQSSDGSQVEEYLVDENRSEIELENRTLQFAVNEAELLTWLSSETEDSEAWSFSRRQQVHCRIRTASGVRPKQDVKLFSLAMGKPIQVNFRNTRIECQKEIGTPILAPTSLIGHDARVSAATLLADGRLISIDESRILKFWNWNEPPPVPRKIKHPITKTEDMFVPVSWVQNGPEKNSVLFASGKIPGHLPMNSKQFAINSSPDGSRSNTDKFQTVYYFDWLIPHRIREIGNRNTNGKERTKDDYLGALVYFQLSPNGRRLITVHDDWKKVETFEGQRQSHPDFQPVRVWDVTTGELLFGLNGITNQVTFAVFNAGGTQIATLQTPFTRLMSRDVRAVGQLNEHSDFGGIDIWDGSTGEHQRTLWRPQENTGQRCSIVWHPAENKILCTPVPKPSNSTSLPDWYPGVLFDTDTGEELTTLEGSSTTTQADFSPDGKHIAGFHPGGFLTVWDSVSGRKASKFASGKAITSTDFSPDSRRILTTFRDGTACVWDLDNPGLSFSLPGHQRTITSGQFSPDGRWIATAGADNSARIWDALTGEEWLKITHDHEPQTTITGAFFTPDSQHLITTTNATFARVWPVDPLFFSRNVIDRKLDEHELTKFKTRVLDDLASESKRFQAELPGGELHD